VLLQINSGCCVWIFDQLKNVDTGGSTSTTTNSQDRTIFLFYNPDTIRSRRLLPDFKRSSKM